DGAAEMDADLLGDRARLDVELLEKIGERKLLEELVDDQAHGAVGVVGAHVDHGALEARILHLGHRHQEMAGQVGGKAHGSPLLSPRYSRSLVKTSLAESTPRELFPFQSNANVGLIVPRPGYIEHGVWPVSDGAHAPSRCWR